MVKMAKIREFMCNKQRLEEERAELNSKKKKC
jgi:hypothetical protein